MQCNSFITEDDQKTNITGLTILTEIVIPLAKEKPNTTNFLSARIRKFQKKLKQWVKENFWQLCVRIGKSKNFVRKTQFIKDMTPIQQKRRGEPTHLQERVKKKWN